MGFVRIVCKNNIQEVYLPKISISRQNVSEILAQLCSADSIQILHICLDPTSSLEWFEQQGIDLVTVFDAILTSRQTREKLQCLYENLMSNNFRKTAVLKKISIVN